jgi:hemolysin III
MESTLPAARVKPLLRGVSHQIAAFAAAPAALALVASARSRTAAAAAIVYAASVFTLFAVSAFYHRPFWSAAARAIIGRLDHSAIFLLIAGTYTPLCLLLGRGAGRVLLAAVWTGAAAGILFVVGWAHAPKPLKAAIYVLLGWCVVPALPALLAAIGPGSLALLVGGGLMYTAGATIYALRRPDPFPTVFGFHEIFHVLVVAAAVCHFVVVSRAIQALN